jgi:hypothetical protein
MSHKRSQDLSKPPTPSVTTNRLCETCINLCHRLWQITTRRAALPPQWILETFKTRSEWEKDASTNGVAEDDNTAPFQPACQLCAMTFVTREAYDSGSWSVVPLVRLSNVPDGPTAGEHGMVRYQIIGMPDLRVPGSFLMDQTKATGTLRLASPDGTESVVSFREYVARKGRLPQKTDAHGILG